jgi:hypothetical protein
VLGVELADGVDGLVAGGGVYAVVILPQRAAGGGVRTMIVVMADFRRRARELAPKVRTMKLRRVAYHEAAHAIVAAHFGLVVDQVGVEVAARLEAGVVVAVRGRPLVRATVLAAGGEAERQLTGQEPRGIEADDAELDRMHPPTAARGRAEARRLVVALWPYIEALAAVIVEYTHMSGPTAIFMALLAVHGEDEARRREALLAKGQTFDLALASHDLESR